MRRKDNFLDEEKKINRNGFKKLYFCFMAKLILHAVPYSEEQMRETRMLENLALTPIQRWKKMFALMQISASLKTGRLKQPQGKGIVLKSKKWQ